MAFKFKCICVYMRLIFSHGCDIDHEKRKWKATKQIRESQSTAAAAQTLEPPIELS